MKASRSATTAVVRSLTPLQVESWRLLWRELERDTAAVAEMRDWERRRRRALPEMRLLLRRFLTGRADLETLRATLDQRTKTRWDAFGLRGLSGAMFLTRLASHLHDEGGLESALREALAEPGDEDEGRARLGGLVDYLRGRVTTPDDARVLQPARAAFFVTIWWHVQDPERWPGYQLSARRALQLEEELWTPTGDPVADYFHFRDGFLALAAALGVRGWELEFLCWWHGRRPRESGEPLPDDRPPAPVRLVRERPPAPRRPRPPREAEPGAAPDHTHVQWLLASLGRRLGCRVWVAANDHAREWEGEPLAALSIPRLPPLGLDAEAQRVVSLIDVVWLRGSHVAAAFEVERTTSIYSGLLRMADLAALAPNLNFPLYLVAPARRLEKVRRELRRPAFQALELHRRAAFFSSEALLAAADGIRQWGTGPAVIERLAERVEIEPGEH